MPMRRHLKDSVLSQFVDGRLSPARHERVVSHLSDCARCRAEVELMRKTGELARSLEPRPAPPDAIDRILRRRAQGERVLLPTESPGSVEEPRTPWRMIAAALVGLFMVGLLFTDLLEADRPAALQIQPERPEAGEVLLFTYDDGTQFQTLDRLLLRARYNAASGARWQEVGAILVRGENGLFRARLDLPDSAVYAEFAVESPDGQIADLDHGAPWEVLVHEPDGRPNLEGLTGRVRELHRRGDNRRVMESARLMATHYPESPRTLWAELSVESGTSLPPSRVDEIRSTLRAFERRFARSPPEHIDDLAYLAWVAFTINDLEGGRIWLDLAQRSGARGIVVDQSVAALTVFDGAPPNVGLDRLEEAWQRRSFPIFAVANTGLQLALEAGDWDAALRWFDRQQQSRAGLRLSGFLTEILNRFGPERALEWGMSRVDLELGRMASGRPIHRTPDHHRRALAAERQASLILLADMAHQTGRKALAAEFARKAIPLSWETRDLQRAGSILLAVGDTGAALEAYARAAADPAAGPTPEAVLSRQSWVPEYEAARRGLREYVAQDQVNRTLPAAIAAEVEGAVTVVAFISTCTELQHVASVAAALGDTPVRVYPDYDEFVVREALAGCDAPLRLRPDPDGSWRTAFHTIGQPYFVTDRLGRIRFEHGREPEVLRRVEALLAPPRTRLAD